MDRRRALFFLSVLLFGLRTNGQQNPSRASVSVAPFACVDDSKLSPQEKDKLFPCELCSHIIVPTGFLTNASLRLGKQTVHDYVLPGDDSTKSLHLGSTSERLIYGTIFDRYRGGEKSGTADVVIVLTNAFGRKVNLNLWRLSWSIPPGPVTPPIDLPAVTPKLLANRCRRVSAKSAQSFDPALFVN